MGRASRPPNKNTPDMLRELQEEGLPDGWGRYWHGAKDVMLDDPEPAPEPIDFSQLSDAELLQQIADMPELQLDTCDRTLLVGDTIVHPDKNNREYRGVIRLTLNDEGAPVFQGVTQWGPSGKVGEVSSRSKVVYEGSQIESAAITINRIINKKMQDGYQAPSQSRIYGACLAGIHARQALNNLLEDASVES